MATRHVPTGPYPTVTAALSGISNYTDIDVIGAYAGTNEDWTGLAGKTGIRIRNVSGLPISSTFNSSKHVSLGDSTTVEGGDAGWVWSISVSGSAGLWCNAKTSCTVNDVTIYKSAGIGAKLECKFGGTARLTMTRCIVAAPWGTGSGSPCLDLGQVNSSYLGVLTFQNGILSGGTAGMYLTGVSATYKLLYSYVQGSYKGVSTNGGTISPNVDVRFCQFTGSTMLYGVELNMGAASNPTMTIYRNILDPSRAGYVGLKRGAAALPNVDIKGNWSEKVEFPTSADRDYNAYQTLVAGTGGAHDVVTSSPGFVDRAGLNYRLTPSSPLHNAGWDTGDLEDADGNPTPVGQADIGRYELPVTNGGLVEVVLADAFSGTVEFTNPGATGLPLQASAEDVSNYVLTGAHAIELLSMTRQVDTLYAFALDRPTVDGEAFTLDASAVETVGGGHVTDPGSVGFAGVLWPHGKLLGAQALSTRLVRARFDGSPGYSRPDPVAARDGAVWLVERVSTSSEVPVTKARREDAGGHSWVLSLGSDLAEELFELTTDDVPSEDGGHC